MTTIEGFWAWVEREMAARDLSFYQLERKAGVGNATVSRPAREWREPTLMVCQAIARGLDVALEDVLRRAGHLPPRPPTPTASIPRLHTFLDKLARLDRDAQNRIMDTALMLLEIDEAARDEVPAQTTDVLP